MAHLGILPEEAKLIFTINVSLEALVAYGNHFLLRAKTHGL
jgi:hypothetical protein